MNFWKWFLESTKYPGHPKWAGVVEPIETDRDMSGAFAIEENHPLWLAVHQVVNEAERECIEGARKYVANTNMCINSVGAGEGVALVRTKLIQKREAALKEFHGPGTNIRSNLA